MGTWMQLRNGTWNYRIKPQQKLPKSPLYRKKNESPYRNKLCYKYFGISQWYRYGWDFPMELNKTCVKNLLKKAQLR